MNFKLKLIKPISWEEVFLLWEKQEADLTHWIEHYKSRGFDSWRDWRKNSIKDLPLDKLKWSFCEILMPLETVPSFHAGPFRAWMKKCYKGEQTVTFQKLGSNAEIQNDAVIGEIMNNFPKDSTLIGLINNDRMLILEGLHRCCALAVAKEKGIDVEATLFIACAEFSGELPLLGQENSPT